MYDRGAWFLKVIMLSSCALWCLPSVKQQKNDFHFSFRSMNTKTIVRLGFCDITITKAAVRVINHVLDYSGYHRKPHPIVLYNPSVWSVHAKLVRTTRPTPNWSAVIPSHRYMASGSPLVYRMCVAKNDAVSVAFPLKLVISLSFHLFKLTEFGTVPVSL